MRAREMCVHVFCTDLHVHYPKKASKLMLETVQTVCCQTQFSFANGSNMCTTACMQVGMAILCNQVNLGGVSSRSDSEIQQSLGSILTWCMEVSSVVHGRVEGILEGGSVSHRSRMVSINELVRTLHIDLKSLGIGVEELMVCRRGAGTPIRTRVRPREQDDGCSSSLQQSGSKKRRMISSWLKYEADSCYISLEHLPTCMLLASSTDADSSGNMTCVGMATANGHTVCVCCYKDSSGALQERYALFDPAPGRLCMGLSARQLVDMLKVSLSIPESAVRSSTTSHVQQSHDATRGNNEGEEGEERDDTTAAIRRKKKRCNDGSSSLHDLHKDAFYCDVTLFYIQERL